MPSLAELFQQYLAANKPAAQDPNNIDYDPSYEQGLSTGIRDTGNLANQLDLNKNQARVGYQQQVSDLGRQRDVTLEGLQNRLAGQGILHSGINIGEQGKIGENYQRGADSAGTGLANVEQQADLQFNSALGTFGDTLANLQRQHARYIADRKAARAADDAAKKAAEDAVTQGAADLAKQQAEQAAQAEGPTPAPNGELYSPGQQPVQLPQGEQISSNNQVTPDMFPGLPNTSPIQNPQVPASLTASPSGITAQLQEYLKQLGLA